MKSNVKITVNNFDYWTTKWETKIKEKFPKLFNKKGEISKTKMTVRDLFLITNAINFWEDENKKLSWDDKRKVLAHGARNENYYDE